MNRPNILILGVSHSGTSIITKMLYEMGWKTNEKHTDYAPRGETKWVHDINRPLVKHIRKEELLKGKDFINLEKEMISGINSEMKPFALKDPRFVLTLNYWQKAIEKSLCNPILIMILKTKEQLKKSLSVRSEKVVREGNRVPGVYGMNVKELTCMCEKQFDKWNGIKVRLSYDGILKAIKLFDIKRLTKNKGKAGI